MFNMFTFNEEREQNYLSNCMLPPLASTSCTDMLIPLLLLMNGLLFDVHELELKRQRFETRVFDASIA